MTPAEKEAILGYIEFSLTQMVQVLEQEGIINGTPQVGAVYDAAYEVLNDMERTLTDHLELVAQEQQASVNK